MKLPVAPIQRIVLGVAVAAVVTASISAVAIVTQPASATDDGAQTTEMTLIEPAVDEPTTTTTEPVTLVTIAAQALGATDDRAEKAAERAETAAVRSEVAAVKTETIVATISTMPPTTSSTTVTRPILVDVTPPTIPTTTTTTAPKAWVEIARFPRGQERTGGPAVLDVTFQTGQLRVSDPHAPLGSSMTDRYGMVAAWIGDGETPGDDACMPTPGGCASWTVPTGHQTLHVGRRWDPRSDSQSGGGWFNSYGTGADLVIEEYR